jgi:hypothetical protein
MHALAVVARERYVRATTTYEVATGRVARGEVLLEQGSLPPPAPAGQDARSCRRSRCLMCRIPRLRPPIQREEAGRPITVLSWKPPVRGLESPLAERHAGGEVERAAPADPVEQPPALARHVGIQPQVKRVDQVEPHKLLAEAGSLYTRCGRRRPARACPSPAGKGRVGLCVGGTPSAPARSRAHWATRQRGTRFCTATCRRGLDQRELRVVAWLLGRFRPTGPNLSRRSRRTEAIQSSPPRSGRDPPGSGRRP